MTLVQKLSELVGMHVCISCPNDAYSGQLIECGEGYIVVDEERWQTTKRIVIFATSIESITATHQKGAT